MKLTLQRATPRDAEAMATLVNSAYRGESSKRGWTTEADLLGGQRTDAGFLREEMAKAENAFLLFHLKERLVACVALTKRDDGAYLGMLTVAPDLQATGIGKTILNRIEAWARENWRVTRIEMTVIARRTELVAWYERRGYVNTGKRVPFPAHDTRVGLPKVPDLDMIVLEKILVLNTDR